MSRINDLYDAEIEDEIFQGTRTPNIAFHISNIKNNIPRTTMLKPTEQIDENLLKSCIIYYMYTYRDDIVNLVEYIFNKFSSIAIECVEKIVSNDYITLFPGDSPLVVWFAVQYLLPDHKSCYVFPLSGIENYDDIQKQKLKKSLEDLKSFLLDFSNLNTRFESYIEYANSYNETRKNILYFPTRKRNQHKVVTEYIHKILEHETLDRDILYIDYIATGRLLKQLKESLKTLNYTHKVESISIEEFIHDESRRCTASFKVDKISDFLQNNLSLEDIPHDYLRCNVILYIYNCYLFNQSMLIDFINETRSLFRIYTQTTLSEYIDKRVNIEYVNVSDEFKGSVVEIVKEYDVIVEKVTHDSIQISGKELKISPRFVLSVESD